MTRTPLLPFLIRMLRCERGDPIVEFILVLPLMLLLGFGVMEVARILWYQHSITKGVRDGTRYLTRVPLTGAVDCVTPVTGPAVDTATGLALNGAYWGVPDPAAVTVTLCPIPNDDNEFYGPNPLRMVQMTARVDVPFSILRVFLRADPEVPVTFTISNQARHIGQ
jgi:Flp pilus assembly protein TadG